MPVKPEAWACPLGGLVVWTWWSSVHGSQGPVTKANDEVHTRELLSRSGGGRGGGSVQAGKGK